MSGVEFLDSLASVLAGCRLVLGLATEAIPLPPNVDLRVPVRAFTFAAIDVGSHDRLPT